MRNQNFVQNNSTLVLLLKEAQEWVTDKPWDDSTLLHKRISKALNPLPNQPFSFQNESNKLTNLLTEAREWVTDKPWDDSTFLHKRISEELNLPISYPEYFETDEEVIEIVQPLEIKRNFKFK